MGSGGLNKPQDLNELALAIVHANAFAWPPKVGTWLLIVPLLTVPCPRGVYKCFGEIIALIILCKGVTQLTFNWWMAKDAIM